MNVDITTIRNAITFERASELYEKFKDKYYFIDFLNKELIRSKFYYNRWHNKVSQRFKFKQNK